MGTAAAGASSSREEEHVSAKRERCQGPGSRVIYTRDQAREWLEQFRRTYGKGRGRIYLCAWGDHYHITRGERKKGL